MSHEITHSVADNSPFVWCLPVENTEVGMHVPTQHDAFLSSVQTVDVQNSRTDSTRLVVALPTTHQQPYLPFQSDLLLDRQPFTHTHAQLF